VRRGKSIFGIPIEFGMTKTKGKIKTVFKSKGVAV